ncbi:hypothetical protein PF005_g24513 [Phytophthora fragariae]|uniref:Uncharacterized protein n=1 Tax=Phytophthora fragariae TaxID=53985 RepID=A0A6A3W242_9STRA|nr:hypothetical protein PF005_g24513 [Phytophthora fragariae]
MAVSEAVSSFTRLLLAFAESLLGLPRILTSAVLLAQAADQRPLLVDSQASIDSVGVPRKSSMSSFFTLFLRGWMTTGVGVGGGAVGVAATGVWITNLCIMARCCPGVSASHQPIDSVSSYPISCGSLRATGMLGRAGRWGRCG